MKKYKFQPKTNIVNKITKRINESELNNNMKINQNQNIKNEIKKYDKEIIEMLTNSKQIVSNEEENTYKKQISNSNDQSLSKNFISSPKINLSKFINIELDGFDCKINEKNKKINVSNHNNVNNHISIVNDSINNVLIPSANTSSQKRNTTDKCQLTSQKSNKINLNICNSNKISVLSIEKYEKIGKIPIITPITNKKPSSNSLISLDNSFKLNNQSYSSKNNQHKNLFNLSKRQRQSQNLNIKDVIEVNNMKESIRIAKRSLIFNERPFENKKENKIISISLNKVNDTSNYNKKLKFIPTVKTNLFKKESFNSNEELSSYLNNNKKDGNKSSISKYSKDKLSTYKDSKPKSRSKPQLNYEFMNFPHSTEESIKKSNLINKTISSSTFNINKTNFLQNNDLIMSNKEYIQKTNYSNNYNTMSNSNNSYNSYKRSIINVNNIINIFTSNQDKEKSFDISKNQGIKEKSSSSNKLLHARQERSKSKREFLSKEKNQSTAESFLSEVYTNDTLFNNMKDGVNSLKDNKGKIIDRLNIEVLKKTISPNKLLYKLREKIKTENVLINLDISSIEIKKEDDKVE